MMISSEYLNEWYAWLHSHTIIDWILSWSSLGLLINFCSYGLNFLRHNSTTSWDSWTSLLHQLFAADFEGTDDFIQSPEQYKGNPDCSIPRSYKTKYGMKIKDICLDFILPEPQINAKIEYQKEETSFTLLTIICQQLHLTIRASIDVFITDQFVNCEMI